jgi:hypothetical protein
MRVAVQSKPARDAKPAKATKPTVRLPTDPIPQQPEEGQVNEVTN